MNHQPRTKAFYPRPTKAFRRKYDPNADCQSPPTWTYGFIKGVGEK